MSGIFEQVAVFIIIIDPTGERILGACYWNELLAQEEVGRLRAAQPGREVIYVERWLPFPLFASLDDCD